MKVVVVVVCARYSNNNGGGGVPISDGVGDGAVGIVVCMKAAVVDS